MKLDPINRIGDINPQLFRELKGRFIPRNLMVAAGISLLTQFLVVLGFLGELPDRHHEYDRYCTGGKPEYHYHQLRCLMDSFGDPEINWQLWWSDVFLWTTTIGIFVLLVGATYILISDLDREERRGTLNFIRLSPQSTRQILVGKLLGAPSLLFVGCVLAFPLHLLAASHAGISLNLVALYYVVLFACSAFCFSGAIFLGLVSKWMGGFQAWLGSSLVLMCLFLTSLMRVEDAPIDVLKLFSPSSLIPYLMPEQFAHAIRLFNYDMDDLILHSVEWHWFVLPIGITATALTAAMVVACSACTVWIWQFIDRRFRNPHTTLVSKQQSYWVTGCYTILVLGLAPHGYEFENLNWILGFNLIFFAGLMAALSPQRQVCIDWARYRHMSPERKQGLFNELMSSDKSPALLAIAFNLLEAQLIILPWILMWHNSKVDRLYGAFSLLLNFSMLLFCASIAQLVMMMKSKKRGLWAMTSVSGIVALPPLVLLVLSAHPDTTPLFWMFTVFPWEALNYAEAMTVMVSVLTQWAAIGAISTQYSRKLREAGVSASKALAAGGAESLQRI